MSFKILIVSANYYENISNNLEKDARESLDLFVKPDEVKYKIINVRGVFEIPVVISKFINEYDGFISLACVIKGETPHFNFISTSATDAIMKLSINHKKPIGNGIITCLNKEQAVKRSKTKGKEAAAAVYDVLLKFKYD